MAKSDFCFTYYDGDAARDMSHMDRLERGAYTDVIMQQRKRGHLSKEDLEKFLSKDFERVWPSLQWVLSVDEDGKYYVEWLDNAINKDSSFSNLQKGRRSSKTQKPAEKAANSDRNDNPVNRNGSSVAPKEDSVQPILYIEDGDGDKGGVGENNHGWPTRPGPKHLNWPLPDVQRGKVQELLKIMKGVDASYEQIECLWSVFKVQHFTGRKYYDHPSDAYSHFFNLIRKMKTDEIKTSLDPPAKPMGGSSAREKHDQKLLEQANQWKPSDG